MRERRRVARVLELTEHLRVREDLAGVLAAEPKELTHERRLVHGREELDVARDRRLDERVEDVGAPALLVAGELRRARVAAEVEEALEVPAERSAHLAEAPVGDARQLEPSGEAVGEPALHEQGGAAEEDDLQPRPGGGVLVPVQLDDVGPPRSFLHLVEDQQRCGVLVLARARAAELPLRGKPAAVEADRFVGRCVLNRECDGLRRLPGERRLADLARAREHLDEPPRLEQTRYERLEGGAVEGWGARQNTQRTEYFYSIH